jgi:acetyl-CoA carboxylase alpha subunit
MSYEQLALCTRAYGTALVAGAADEADVRDYMTYAVITASGCASMATGLKNRTDVHALLIATRSYSRKR